MIRIRGPTDLSYITDPPLHRLILFRMAQLADEDVYDPERHGELFVVEPGDGADDIEVACGFLILSNLIDGARYADPDYIPSADLIEDHGFCYEAVFALNDIGTALFVPRQPGVDPELLSMCADFSVPAAIPPR